MVTITDMERLDFLEEECLDIRCKENSYGDDADVYYEIIQHHQAKPHERVIGIGKTPRQAIDEAIKHIIKNGSYVEYDYCAPPIQW